MMDYKTDKTNEARVGEYRLQTVSENVMKDLFHADKGFSDRTLFSDTY
jgi:hypothetical protein